MEDFSEVAAAVLLDPTSHNRARYEMVRDNMSHYDAAKVLSRTLGREIPCVQISIDEIVKLLQSGGIGVGEWGEDAARRLFFYYDRWWVFCSLETSNLRRIRLRGLTGNTNVLTWLLGRKLTDIADYVEKEVARFQSRSKG
jgi:hypothetical protein